MLLDIIKVEYVDEYKIKLTFEDGKKRIVDFRMYLEKGGIFKKFKDLAFFRAFHLDKEIGNVIWNDEIDIAPETLYYLATATAKKTYKNR